MQFSLFSSYLHAKKITSTLTNYKIKMHLIAQLPTLTQMRMSVNTDRVTCLPIAQIRWAVIRVRAFPAILGTGIIAKVSDLFNQLKA